MKNINNRKVVKIKKLKSGETLPENIKAKRKTHAFLKNVAIFLSAFFVLYLFFIITFGNLDSTNKTVFYALSSGSFDSQAEAYAEADKIKLVGGGGNVWLDGEDYKVIAFVYNDATSAGEVQTRLKEEGLSLTVTVMEINTAKLEDEEKLFISSTTEISAKVYDIMVSMSDFSSTSQTTALLDEVKKSLITTTTRTQLLAESETAKENIAVTGALVSDAFTQVTSSETVTTQSLAWLRTQILIYASEYTKNY
ncbi:MAG: hypothetical protein R3Y18_00610 [Bacillota bacterium]